MSQPLIAPSVLAANFLQLQSEIELINSSEADWIHFDVMDGHFVPNLSFGFPLLKAIKPIATKPIDVHLMISNPELYIEQYAEAGADIISVHVEACDHLHRVIQQIKATGKKASVALNPHTPVEVLNYVIKDVDVVLVMSVNPGFGGQSFIESTYQKVKDLKHLIQENLSDALIEIDGGVSLENAAQLVEWGADVLVAGSSVFKADNPKKMIAQLKSV